MKESFRPIDEMVEQLSPGKRAEVRDFVEFLLARQRSTPRRTPRFDWAGALKDMSDDYTSVELQHEISISRSEVERS